MRHIEYKTFQLTCALEGPVNGTNYFIYDIAVRNTDGEFMFHISRYELSKFDTECLLSGDEELAVRAFENILASRKAGVADIENFLHKIK